MEVQTGEAPWDSKGSVRSYLSQEQKPSYLKIHLVLFCTLYLPGCVCLSPGEAAWNVETALS